MYQTWYIRLSGGNTHWVRMWLESGHFDIFYTQSRLNLTHTPPPPPPPPPPSPLIRYRAVHPSSVCHPSVVCPSINSFFKSNRRPQFLSDLSDIWHEYAQQYCPKNRSKVAIFEVFGHFCKQFSWPDPKTWFTDRLWELLDVCKNWPWGPYFWPRIGPKLSQKSVLVCLAKSFQWINKLVV